MKNQLLITNIQRFSLHDGPGIRTTIFLKGCLLKCPWCSNPENQEMKTEKYFIDGIEGIYGEYYTQERLIDECLKDKSFYNGTLERENWTIDNADNLNLLPGGITFSGGEFLLQMNEIKPVCEILRKEGIHITGETSLFAPTEKLLLALECIDFFYVDLKILNSVKCKKIEKGILNLFLINLNILMKSKKPIIVRVPVIGGYTDDEWNRKAIFTLIEKYKSKILKIELIKEHNLGAKKYLSLGKYYSYKGIQKKDLDLYLNELAKIGLPIEICSI